MANFPDDYNLYIFIRNSKISSPASRMPFSSASVFGKYLTWVMGELAVRDSLNSDERKLLEGLIEATKLNFDYFKDKKIEAS
jgi:hypothetical protein